MKIIFIDGYNVINSWPNLKREKEVSFANARQKLIDVLHNYSEYNNCLIKIVFDAHKVAGNIEKVEEYNKKVYIIFTKDGETADAYIEREVHAIGRKYEVYVVTSDWLEQQTIFQRGAARVSSLEFYNEVNETEKQIAKDTVKNNIKRGNSLDDIISEDILKQLEIMRRM